MKRQALLALASAALTMAGMQAHAADSSAAGGTNMAAKISLDKCAKPEWPKAALAAEQTGKVTLAYRIGADGSVMESKVAKSSGYPLLDEAARTGLMKCQFQPAIVNGRAEPSWMQMQYVWKLEGDQVNIAFVQEFEAARVLAEQGDTVAQRQLGTLYTQGKGVARDFAQGLAWFERAAAAGDAEAQFRAATAYLRGFGVARDPARAAGLLVQAAAQNHALAQVTLAIQYLKGDGVTQDEAQAAELLRKAAAQNHPTAFAPLANMTQHGRGGIIADPAEALRMLRRGAELGDFIAQYQLGIQLQAAATQEEQAEGAANLRKAAETRMPQVQAALGLAYRDGKGVPQDYQEARNWLAKAAAQSWPPAQCALAALTEQGLGGARNDEEALRLYQKAAAYNVRAAALRLAETYERGELGNPVDPARGAEWRVRANNMAAYAPGG